jgi:DNA-binding transcriptional regulator YiaG
MAPSDIRDTRESLDMTQTDLAQALGVSLRTVCYWEAGEKRPSGAANLLLEQFAKKAARKGGRS